MSSREKLLLLGLVLIVAASGGYLYLQRPEASEPIPAQAQLEFTSGATLRGGAENTAVLESVTVGDDGTIELAPEAAQ